MYVSADACARAECSTIPSERSRERRGHHRLGRVFQGHVGLLESIDSRVEIIPFALLRGQQHHHQIGAHAEIAAFVRDHHGVEVLLGFFDARV
jgi:hypothetical protein